MPCLFCLFCLLPPIALWTGLTLLCRRCFASVVPFVHSRSPSDRGAAACQDWLGRGAQLQCSLRYSLAKNILHKYIYIYTYTYTHKHVYTYMIHITCTHIHPSLYLYVYIYIYEKIYVYVFIYISLSIYIYMHA